MSIDHDGSSQIVEYDAGVGTQWYDKASGGALGAGLSHNVRQAYKFLLENYKPGDEIYLFGFSRGAYTARSLCGFIQLVGQLADKDDVKKAHLYYHIFKQDNKDSLLEKILVPKSVGPMPIKFIGVFDTVGALGIPFEIKDRLMDDTDISLSDKIKNSIDKAGDWLRRPIKGFHNTNLGANVEFGYHALAIDERREIFRPCLWTKMPGEAVQFDTQHRIRKVPQQVEQVWFSGVHSDVGGGYNESEEHGRLANIPLLWMIEKAMVTGLRFKNGTVTKLKQDRDTDTSQHESFTNKLPFLHEISRPLRNEQRKTINPEGDLYPLVHTSESVHNSVQKRIGKKVRVIDKNGQFKNIHYDPLNLR